MGIAAALVPARPPFKFPRHGIYTMVVQAQEAHRGDIAQAAEEGAVQDSVNAEPAPFDFVAHSPPRHRAGAVMHPRRDAQVLARR